MIGLAQFLPYLILPITSGTIQLLNNRNTLGMAARQQQAQLELQRLRHQEQVDLVERQHQARLAENETLARLQQELRRQEATYPILGGPGTLRDTVLGTFGSPGAMPPLVLVQPPKDETGGQLWNGVRQQAQDHLGTFHNEHLIHVPAGWPDRHFPWPDMRLYAGDLRDIPTIVVQLITGADRLSIWIGGCHLVPHGAPVIRPVRALSIHYRRADQWDEASVRAVNAQRMDTRDLAVPVGGRITELAAHRLMTELASTAVALCVVRVMDMYHLMHHDHYDERFPRVMERALPGIGALPEVPGPPPERVRDPVYYLLSQADHLLRRGQGPRAERAVGDALRILLGPDAQPPARLLPEMMPRVALARRVLGRFPEAHPLRQRFLPVLEGIQPPPAPAAAPAAGGVGPYNPDDHPFGR